MCQQYRVSNALWRPTSTIYWQEWHITGIRNSTTGSDSSIKADTITEFSLKSKTSL